MADQSGHRLQYRVRSILSDANDYLLALCFSMGTIHGLEMDDEMVQFVIFDSSRKIGPRNDTHPQQEMVREDISRRGGHILQYADIFN